MSKKNKPRPSVFAKPPPNTRVSIVFEETNNVEGGFNVYMEGHDKSALEKIPPEEWPRAAFWAIHCFSIVGGVISQAGAVVGKVEKGKG